MWRSLCAAAVVLLAMGCGPSQPATCAEITDQCQCYRAEGCQVVVDGCFCPNDCGANITCYCGGGTFLRCEDAP